MQIIRSAPVLLVSFAAVSANLGAPTYDDPKVAELAKEVRNKGWIIYMGRTDEGNFDLFLSRPDGSDRRNITNTPEYNEGGVRFSPDSRKIIYRRIPKEIGIDRNRWGFQGKLILANADGTNPVVLEGGNHPWASWSPNGKQIATLTRQGIKFVDLATTKVVRTLDRKGIYQQAFWSPDGKWLCGVTNAFGQLWTVARMNLETGEINPIPHNVGSFYGPECTPDWFPDSKHILFSHSPFSWRDKKWTQLWMADGEGKGARLIYAEDGRNIYGGVLSPDAKYVLFNGVLPVSLRSRDG